MSNRIKTIFMGTPELAKIGLKTLIDSDFFDISLIVSQEDKTAGRGMKTIKTPVKVLAEENDIKILQPKRIKEITEDIKEIKPDLIVVIAYGKIIPKEILDIPKYGCINVHGSLLPKYRGSSCVQATILNGDMEGGITIMEMDEQMDTGNIIKKIPINLSIEETSQSLMEKIKELTKNNLVKILNDYIEGNIKSEAQENDLATYVKMIKKEDGYLNFNETAQIIERKSRAYFPWPGVYAFIEKESLPKKKILFKILKLSDVFTEDSSHKVGELFLKDGQLLVKCHDKAIIIEELQLEGKKATKSEEFLKGNAWILGKILK
ncbi:methionyl-tRNA formyltransferase [Candidatus Falkowbacteria bacterium HGW-Falkowbacteria-1]|uniref:Methionyl-tRNA formyltransferase n=1 Tax=Candidatus Falkowbacteria bacterium HGW-Falkowbacteria-1 TaxID=2013768 RepID=A0A2N2EAA6_9BACT|nr:MAG: methionyl-tRNA formyltransferase [Candidatus Falkowbacteria bacterium HGW-Falkowbacteria-1]